MRLICLVLALSVAASASAQDLDRDGLSDALEQALLERFTPTLLLSRDECDGLPASFAPAESNPRVIARDGTIYGRAFPVASLNGRIAVELQFFHLWSRDCGRLPHDLDAEHVSALVWAADVTDIPEATEGTDIPAAAENTGTPGATEGTDIPGLTAGAEHTDWPGVRRPSAASWVAAMWYAAAHEGSVCDASSGASARTLKAETSGPRVFVSRGKHASYFDRGQCKWGCGADQCRSDREVVSRAVVNIGESSAPLNGAAWAHSPRWTLSTKFSSDFDGDVRARLGREDTTTIVPLMMHWRAPQAPLLAGDTAIDGLGIAAESSTGALGKATRAAWSFLKRQR